MRRDEIAKVIDKIKSRSDVLDLDEARARQELVLPILFHLGWDLFDPKEVVVEYVTARNGLVDYALCHKGEPRVFIEAKRPREDLQLHAEQLLGYAFSDGVRIAVLTNGLYWWFYLPMEEGSWERRKFFSIDINTQSVASVADRFCDFLAKDDVYSGAAARKAKETFDGAERSRRIERALPVVWKELIQGPNDILVDLLAEETESKCGYRPSREIVQEFLREVSSGQVAIPSETAPSAGRRRPRRPERRTRKGQHRKDGFIGKNPVRFFFENQEYHVTKWVDILVKVCELMHQRHPGSFRSVLEMHGSRHPYFSRDLREIMDRRGKLIEGTDIYVATKLGADAVVNRARQVLEHFGHSGDDLRVETRSD